MSQLRIDHATADDVPAILRFIRGLAEYEKLADRYTATESSLRETLFGDKAYAEVLIARLQDVAVGYALFFHSYSTFMAKPGLYLEDLFVLTEHRGKGVGKALLLSVARIARERNCGRLEWSVLDWNQPAIDFYKRMGALVMSDWRICRLTEEQLQKLGG